MNFLFSKKSLSAGSSMLDLIMGVSAVGVIGGILFAVMTFGPSSEDSIETTETSADAPGGPGGPGAAVASRSKFLSNSMQTGMAGSIRANAKRRSLILKPKAPTVQRWVLAALAAVGFAVDLAPAVNRANRKLARRFLPRR